MEKISFIALLELILADLKDAKLLALRAVTLLVCIIGYIVLTNQSSLLGFVENFSKDKVIQQVTYERTINYPKQAKEHAAMLYAQSGAEGIFVADYKPKFVNNYQDVIAWEGGLTVNPARMLNMVIDRTSAMYGQHVLGEPYSYVFTEDKQLGSAVFVTSGKEFMETGVKYLYTCPIFDLDNSYSGYVGIGYTELPYTGEVEKHQLENYLERVCEPHARALGRKK